MDFGLISCDGDVMPPHIFEIGLRVITEIYLQFMETVVLPWIKQVVATGCGRTRACIPFFLLFLNQYL